MKTRRSVLAGLGTAGAVGVLAGCLSSVPGSGGLRTEEAWSQFQRSAAHTGSGGLDRTMPAEPTEKWRREYDRVSYQVGPIATTDKLIEGRDGHTKAFTKASGELVWDAGETIVDRYSSIVGPVLAQQQVLFVGSSDRTSEYEAVSLAGANGEVNWRMALPELGAYPSALTVADGLLYLVYDDVDTDPQQLIAISIAEQAIVWTFEQSTFDNVDRPVSVADGVAVYSGYQEYEATGSSPAADDRPGGVGAVDITTGESLWRTRLGGVQGSVAIQDDVVYACPDRGEDSPAAVQEGGPYRVIALDLETGELRWRFKSRNAGAANATLTPEHLYYPNGSDLWAIDPETGVAEWRTKIERFVEATPAVAVGDIVLVGTLDFEGRGSSVIALDRQSGAIRWERPTGEMRVDRIVSTDGAVFVQAATSGSGGEDSETVLGFW